MHSFSPKSVGVAILGIALAGCGQNAPTPVNSPSRPGADLKMPPGAALQELESLREKAEEKRWEDNRWKAPTEVAKVVASYSDERVEKELVAFFARLTPIGTVGCVKDNYHFSATPAQSILPNAHRPAEMKIWLSHPQYDRMYEMSVRMPQGARQVTFEEQVLRSVFEFDDLDEGLGGSTSTVAVKAWGPVTGPDARRRALEMVLAFEKDASSHSGEEFP